MAGCKALLGENAKDIIRKKIPKKRLRIKFCFSKKVVKSLLLMGNLCDACVNLYPITRQENFRLVQIETNIRRHFRVHLNEK